MQPEKLLHRALDAFERRLEAVGDDAWYDATPCTEWDVRDLVGHVVGEVAWIRPLLEGRTIEEVGDSLAGDLLGDDPLDAWRRFAAEARDAADDPDVLDRTVYLSYGESTGRAYLAEVAVDVGMHAWDLARAVGADEHLDPELVHEAMGVLQGQLDELRAAGLIGPALPVSADASEQVRLLALLGRNGGPAAATVDRFNAAVNRQDRDAIATLLAADAVFEDTAPPDGRRHEGRDAIVAFFDELSASARQRTFTVEEEFVAGDGVVVSWRHDWVDDDGDRGHVRGVDLFRVVDGQITEKRSYVKG